MKEHSKELSSDTVLDGKVLILQSKKGFRVSIDSILLASSVGQFSNCLELGSGSGVISICLAKRISNSKIVGIEKNIDLVNLSKKNLIKNNLTENEIKFLCLDIMSSEFSKLFNNTFDRVIMNPPYFDKDIINRSKNFEKASARYELKSDLEDWIEAAYKKLLTKGYLNFIFRTGSLQRVLKILDKRWGDIRIFPLWPKVKKESKLFLVQARKDAKAESKMLPGLISHNKDGSYTDSCNDVLLNRDLVQMD